MALIIQKTQQHLLKVKAQKYWITTYPADTQAPASGIYKCRGCGREVLCYEGMHLPPEYHHKHNVIQGPIFWELVVQIEDDIPLSVTNMKYN